ncbi:MAG TPA: hypothetical protein PLM09_03860, partial [Casimicrobiaceae bacterium]|nr:hypothetical protein [Casimicrobiaceae bacterium]
ALVGEVGAVYGFAAPESVARKSLAQFLNETFHGRAVVGDRAPLGRADLVVREVDAGTTVRVGLRLRLDEGGNSGASWRA